MNSNLTRKAYYFAPDDFAAIDLIRQQYGLSSDSDCIRLALRVLADGSAIKLQVNEKAVKKYIQKTQGK